MILLEGASDAALWQVGQVLRDRFGYSLRRLGVEPTLGDTFWPRIVDAHPRTCFIRSHLTEGVRRRLWGLPERTDRHQVRLTEMALLALGATVLVVESESRPGDLPHTWQQFEPATIAKEYAPEKLWHWAGGKSHLAHTHANLSELVNGDAPSEQLVDIIRTNRIFQENFALKLPPPSLGIGSTAPRVVIVGEAPAPSPCPLETCGDYPDVPFSRGPAADVLWAALDELEFPWWQAYVCNASSFTKHTPWELERIVGQLSVQKVVCLGRHAASTVRGSARSAAGEITLNRLHREGSIGTFAHPSHVRQFRHREIARLRDEIGTYLASECLSDALERTGEGEPE